MSLSEPGALIVIVGAVASMVPVVVSLAVLPAASVTLASTVKSPSASASGTSTVKLPSFSTKAVSVCTLPALSVMVRITVEPVSAVVVPVITGVLSFDKASVSNCISISVARSPPSENSLLLSTEVLFAEAGS